MVKRIFIVVIVILVAGTTYADEASEFVEKIMKLLPKQVGENGDYALYVHSFGTGKDGSKPFKSRSIRTEIIPMKSFFMIQYFQRSLIVDILIPDGHECRTGHLTAQVDKMPLRPYQDTYMTDRLHITFLGDEAFMKQMKLGNKLYLEIGTWGKPIKLTASLKGFANAYNWLTE